MIKTYASAFVRKARESLRVRLARKKIATAGVWFIDIPRTSSTSIRCALGLQLGFPYGKQNVFERQFASKQIFADHQTASEAELALGSSVWGRIVKFTVVRNPWDRVFSMYKYQLRAQQIHPTLDFSSYVRSIYEVCTHQKNWEFLSYKKLWMNQCDFLCGLDGHLDENIRVIHFEERSLGLRSLMEDLGISFDSSLRLQSGYSSSYRNVFTHEDMCLVSEIYRSDVEVFDYKF